MLDVLADPVAVEALVHGHARDPFALLGPHQDGDGFVVRTLQPGAASVQIVARADGAVLANAEQLHQGGLFVAHLAELPPYVLRIDWGGNAIQETEDPYSFGLQLGDVDLHLLAEGTHRDIAACLGAHVLTVDGVKGVRFAVWAPNAQRVSVVGDFNTWDGRRHPMRLRFGAGVWELFIPRLEPGTVYKYEIIGAYGHVLPLKADPVAQAAELPPRTASVVADPAPPRWTDDAWMAGRAARQTEHAPITIYEVHAGSWMRDEHGRPLQWDALADRLIPYARGLGFTHIELLPVTEHPFGGSWGYQPLGLFAPASTFGTPQAFAAFVDRCHEAELGVILDWVPAHFPTDAHGMAQFDGTSLYEHQDPREGFHRDWNTLIYNLGRNEVRGFLIASALHFLEHYHIDGLRVDAVASMLYRDYSRNPGEWVPNIYGGRENLEAVSFLQELSRTVALRCPSAVLIAEESTAWPGVTRPADEGGLGFTFKWNMGWMHDTLHYMGEDAINRSWHHDELTFGLVYAFSEKFILPLSHDEVVHGKGSLIAKMRGDDWQKFANLRAYLGFMWGHPGKKLIFMGIELAQWSEWNHDAQVEWYRQDQPWHRGVQHLVRDLNRLHVAEPALHRLDCAPSGFRWVIGDDRAQSVFAFIRSGEDGDAPVLVVCNFTPVPRYNYRVGVPSAGWWQEILNTDADLYAGSGVGNSGGVTAEAVPDHGEPASLMLTLPPLATIMFRRAH